MQSSQFQPITSSQYSGISTEDLWQTTYLTHHQKTNSNGQRLIDLLEEHALLAANTRFQNDEKTIWTWLSPPDCNQVKHKQQIDFILVRRKWQR